MKENEQTLFPRIPNRSLNLKPLEVYQINPLLPFLSLILSNWIKELKLDESLSDNIKDVISEMANLNQSIQLMIDPPMMIDEGFNKK